MSQSNLAAPASPCVNICALDSEDVCTGCHRSADEISRWSEMSSAEKWSALERVREREAKYYL